MTPHLTHTIEAFVFVISFLTVFLAPLGLAIYLETIGRNVAANTIGILWVLSMLLICCYAVTV